MSTIAHIPGGDTKAPVPVVTRRRSRVPYFLLLPGVAWLLIFFAAPMVFLASQSLQTGSIEEGYRLTWHFGTYGDAMPEPRRCSDCSSAIRWPTRSPSSQGGGRTSFWCW
jgi:spermidine/putrescine transport system permease protein